MGGQLRPPAQLVQLRTAETLLDGQRLLHPVHLYRKLRREELEVQQKALPRPEQTLLHEVDARPVSFSPARLPPGVQGLSLCVVGTKEGSRVTLNLSAT